MGEYEPNDSRDVTQKDGHAPGEPPRTGPREDATREKAKREQDSTKGNATPQQQQKSAQSQQQGGQSQSQSQSSGEGKSDADAGLWGKDAPRTANAPGNPDTQDMQAQPDGPAAGNQPQAIDNPVAAPSLDHDQYEVNQPQNMHQQDPAEERRKREQAEQQERKGSNGFGYGAEDGEEMADAPDASEDETKDEEVEAKEAEKRGYGGLSEAEEEAYDKR